MFGINYPRNRVLADTELMDVRVTVGGMMAKPCAEISQDTEQFQPRGNYIYWKPANSKKWVRKSWKDFHEWMTR